MTPAFTKYLDHGRISESLPTLDAIRDRTKREIERASLEP
jgi:hypothetical protein